MVYNGIDFNERWVADHTLKEFIEHEQHHELSDAEMKEAYDLMKKLVKQLDFNKG